MVQTSPGRRGVLWGRAQARRTTEFALAAPVPAIERRAGPDGGVRLTRLLAMARLTPAQAVTLAADVLSDLEECHATDRPRCPVRSVAVCVAADGRARLADDGPPHDPSAQVGDLAAVAALLDDLRAAMRPFASDSDLITVFERAVTQARRPDGRVSIVAAILRAVEAQHGAGARAELARLVSAAAGSVAARRTSQPAPSVPEPSRPEPSRPELSRPEPSRPEPSRPEPSRRRPRGIGRALVGRTWRWVLSAVMLIAVITVEILFLRDEISRDIQALLEAGRSGSVSAREPAPSPVVPPAPTAAGTIRSVGLRMVERCTPDASCVLRLQVILQPLAEPQTVTWVLQILDGCTGTAATAPGGTVTVPPKAHRADVVTAVTLPRPADLVVRAVTSRPATAASAPVYVPAEGACG